MSIKKKREEAVGKELECRCKRGNPFDLYAVSVLREGDTIGHFHRKISAYAQCS